MSYRLRSRKSWLLALLIVIAVGLLSRLFQTGWVVVDKYLGDALYAVMAYMILGLWWKAPPPMIATWAAILMTGIEFFQLTLIPLHMLASDQLFIRIFARLMGTQFSLLDLLSYGVGIAGVCAVDASAKTS